MQSVLFQWLLFARPIMRSTRLVKPKDSLTFSQ